MIVYVSGQISGMENRNRFAFNDAVLSVKNEFGKMCEVINPIAIGERIDKMFEELSTETGEEKTPDWHDYILILIILAHPDGIDEMNFQSPLIQLQIPMRIYLHRQELCLNQLQLHELSRLFICSVMLEAIHIIEPVTKTV